MNFPHLTKNQLKEHAAILDKKFRRSSGLFQIEGLHLWEECLRSRAGIEWIVVEAGFLEAHPPVHAVLSQRFKDRTYLASPVELRKISDTEHPQGIVAAVRSRKTSISQLPAEPKQLILLLDGIADPGNLGTIIRSADWFGVKDVILNVQCVEVHNPKVVRSAMGAGFRVRFYEDVVLTDVIGELRRKHFHIMAADMSGEEIPANVGDRVALVIGGEAHGVSTDIRKQSDRIVRISKYGNGESLNAAVSCGILLNALAKQTFL